MGQKHQLDYAEAEDFMFKNTLASSAGKNTSKRLDIITTAQETKYYVYCHNKIVAVTKILYTAVQTYNQLA
jgi:uncharacterized DUF497 family protein